MIKMNCDKGPLLPVSSDKPKRVNLWKSTAMFMLAVFAVTTVLLYPMKMMQISTYMQNYFSEEELLSGLKGKTRILPHVRISRAYSHLVAFYDIAKTKSNSRSILNGFNESAMYVANTLKENTDYDVELQPFKIDIFSDVKPPVLQVNGKEYDVATVQHSGSGTVVNGEIVLIKGGCDTSDYSLVEPHHILLLFKEGPCDYKYMLQLGADSNPSAIMLYTNLPGSGPTSASLRRAVHLPVIGISHYAALDILEMMVLNPEKVLGNITTLTKFTTATTLNVIATTKEGDDSSVIIAGSHLDSVPQGPGINDDGSGASGTLEVAVAFYKSGLSKKTHQKVKFAFWSGEE